MRVEVYSDVVCPWCYIGKARFARALSEYPGRDEVEVVFRAFQLDPESPSRPEPLLDALRRKFGARAPEMMRHVGRAAAAEGLTIDWERAISNNTLPAHRLLRLALEEHGPTVQGALAERLFEAHFSDGLDVGDPDTLTAIAADAGLPRDRAIAYLASGEGEAEARRENEQARALGITAVPTFVFQGKYGVPGAQEPEVFLQVLEEAGRDQDAR